MKKFLIIVCFLAAGLVANSQNLTVEGTAPNLYITHTVAPKENFYSVGRLYNQNAKLIASFNNLVMEKGLTIGQRIKIPLNEQNLDANAGGNSAENVPLTHVVGKSESLSKIGADHNLSAQAIKQLNNLSSDNIAPGTPLVVGHLKMSPAAGAVKTTANARADIQPVTKQEPDQQSKAAEAVKVSPASTQTPAENTTASVKDEAPKQTETVAKTYVGESANVTANKQEEVKEAPLKEAPVKSGVPAKSETYSYSNLNNTGSTEGVFASVFSTAASSNSINTKSGEAGTFKSTSGWQDRKYYVLINDITPGTIVKIASSENKVVYAKVLGSMPEMKENNGLLLRMSNAAASYLGIIDPRFPVQISYYQ